MGKSTDNMKVSLPGWVGSLSRLWGPSCIRIPGLPTPSYLFLYPPLSLTPLSWIAPPGPGHSPQFSRCISVFFIWLLSISLSVACDDPSDPEDTPAIVDIEILQRVSKSLIPVEMEQTILLARDLGYGTVLPEAIRHQIDSDTSFYAFILVRDDFQRFGFLFGIDDGIREKMPATFLILGGRSPVLVHLSGGIVLKNNIPRFFQSADVLYSLSQEDLLLADPLLGQRQRDALLTGSCSYQQRLDETCMVDFLEAWPSPWCAEEFIAMSDRVYSQHRTDLLLLNAQRLFFCTSTIADALLFCSQKQSDPCDDQVACNGIEVCSLKYPFSDPAHCLKHCRPGVLPQSTCTASEVLECSEDEVEKISCTPFDPRLQNVGECRTGHKWCTRQTENSSSVCSLCEQFTGPRNEECNGLDDNCNGEVDEKITEECLSEICGREGHRFCVEGVWSSCITDDSLECVCRPRDIRNCYEGPLDTVNIGVCRGGTQECNEEGSQWGDCLDQVLPESESCDGVDNDCDGTNDEDFSIGSECTTGIGGCKSYGLSICSSGGDTSECSAIALPPTPEICNGIDDDCDGGSDNIPSSDLPLLQGCYSGPIGSRNIGICQDGTQVCVNGEWQRCAGETTPAPQDICNSGLDENCNGVTDESCP